MPKRVNVEESNEKLDSVKNDAPESKYQGDQQVANTDSAKLDVSETSFSPKKKEVKTSQLRQEVASETVKDALYGGSNSGDGLSFAGRAVSGNVGGVAGAANATPRAGQARSQSRDGKKLDRNSTKMNFIPNDQVITSFDESKPLADAAEKDQGFNGTYRNEYARLQKKKGNVPSDLMFDRSLDVIKKDVIYHGVGQEVKQSGVAYNDECLYRSQPDQYGVYQAPSSPNYAGDAKGSYLTTDAHMSVAGNGAVKYMYFDEIDMTAENVTAQEANKSSVAKKILMNDSELVRESIDSKAGDEKADIWSCLARAVAEPTNTVALLRDMEADTGNEILTAYRKFSTSMAFQINRAHKDGQNAVTPIIDALYGFKGNYVSDDALKSAEGNNITACFNEDDYLVGCPQLMIALYDTVGKYHSKADFLVQPRGFRMHLQTADNNLDPFKVNKRFVQAYDATECFSTIDHEYDGNLPVLMTDKAGVTHRLSWNRQYAFVKPDQDLTLKAYNDNDTVRYYEVVPARFISRFKNKYLHIVTKSELVGDWHISDHGVITIDKSNESPYARIRITDSSTSLAESGETDINKKIDDNFTSIVVSTGRIIDSYLDPNQNPIYLDDQYGPYVYGYNDLRNAYHVTVDHPLLKGIVDYFQEQIGSKLFSLIKGQQLDIKTIHSTYYFSLWSMLVCAATPYIGRCRINSMRDVLYYEKNIEYPFSSTLISLKEVLTKAYTNFNYSDYDHELGVKPMGTASKIKWLLPELFQKVGLNSNISSYILPWYANQNEIYVNNQNSLTFDEDAAAMSMPSIRSGIRLGVLDDLYGLDEKDIRLAYDMISSFRTLASSYNATRCGVYKYGMMTDGQPYLGFNTNNTCVLNYLKLPRQIGYVMDAPYGLLTPKYNGSYVTSAIDSDTDFLHSTSFAAIYWFGAHPTAFTVGGDEAILDATEVNVNRAANFTQSWYKVLASGTIPPTDHGMILSGNACLAQDGSILAGRATFHPYRMNDAATTAPTNMVKMLTLQKYYWTRLQKLPFIISPFDIINLSSVDNNTFDIWDFAALFGFAGFRASDFRESVYNREKEIVNQGILFVNDPWVDASVLFREGSSTSGLKISKGFELK